MSGWNLFGPNRFAHGVMTYLDQFGSDPNTRIVVPVTFENTIRTTAIVDTGAPWCVLSPEDAEELNIDQRAECQDTKRLMVRGTWYGGKLCRIPISLEAEQGRGITIEGTVFIPVLRANDTWTHPNFLGLEGFLHRIRLAIDPENNHFYFSALGED